jgi:uncharacterized protein YaiE (UPF0345 family)
MALVLLFFKSISYPRFGLLNIAILADGTYKQATAINSKLPCISGTATVNTDNSVTLNNCKLMLNDTGTTISVSGNIQSNTTVSGASAKSELTLTNMNIRPLAKVRNVLGAVVD